MNKCVFFVSLLALQPWTGDCLYAGDSCFADQNPGSCKPLSQCTALLSEVQTAGTPIPSPLRRKLQTLACGFQGDEPMVCCSAPFTNPVSANEVWPNTNGMGVVTDSPFINVPTDGSVMFPYPNDDRRTQEPPRRTSSIETHRNFHLLPENICGNTDEDRIWGGIRTHLFEIPWMALLSYDSPRGQKLSCGGTLITDRYVLTAAHCVAYLGDRLTLNGVILGEWDVRQDPDCERLEDGILNCAVPITNATISRVIAHPGYKPSGLTDDIALIRLSRPANFSQDNIKPVCLPTTQELQDASMVGLNGVVTGWGATEDGLQSPVLLSVSLPVVTNEACEAAYNGNPKIVSTQLCAGGVPEKDSCGGDSGGPLVYPGRISNGGVRQVQRGIVSFGVKRCGIGGYPGVYTRVSSYMNWILDNITA